MLSLHCSSFQNNPTERERERERERGGSLDFSFFQVWLRFVWTCKGIVLCYWSLIKVDNLVVAFEEATSTWIAIRMY